MGTQAARLSVKPLMCDGCGAALALGTSATARCPYCGQMTPVPTEHGELQRAARSFADNRQLAAQLYGDLGKPPGRLVRRWIVAAKSSGRIGGTVGGGVALIGLFNPAIGLVVALAAAYALGFPVAAVLGVINDSTGQPFHVPLSPYLVLPVTYGALALFIGIPMLWAARERELAEVRMDVQASLAAKPPHHAGGPSCCWNCGAALDVPAKALGVPCVYCHSDNLVALPPKWVAAVRERTHKQFTGIHEALDEFRQAKIEARDRLWRLGFWLFALFPLVLALAAIMEALEIAF